MTPYLERWAGDFRARVELVSYDELFRSTALPQCVHVFTDIDRIDPQDRERAAYLWATLRRAAPRLELLNHPLLAMRRYELLRSLRESGINEFDVYQLTEARRPRRFPVFLRVEDDHLGPRSELLASQEAVDAAVTQLVASGEGRDRRIAVEFHAQKEADGLYRKYAAFYIAGTVLARHLMIGPHWMVKDATRIRNESTLAEQRRYCEENPHAEWIASVFRLARIDYGRIDYGIVDGRLQVFEINMNPTIVTAETVEKTPHNLRFTAALTAAYEELEARNGGAKHASELPRIAVDPPLRSRSARLVGGVLARLARRQLRRPV
jgi:hypothetical protein